MLVPILLVYILQLLAIFKNFLKVYLFSILYDQKFNKLNRTK